MKKRIIILLVIILISILVIIFTIIAFSIGEKYLSRFALCADLVFGTGSLMTSILALCISVDADRKAEKLRIQKLESDARIFIDENQDEISYLPLCLMANAFDNHHKYIRKIYNAFNVLSVDIQKEVLKQLKYEEGLIQGNEWIDNGFKSIRKFIVDNDLGEHYLFSNRKYFDYAIRKYSSKHYDGKEEFEHIMPDLFHWNSKVFENDDKTTFSNYLDSFLHAKKNNSKDYQLNKSKKPLDLLIETACLRSCPESKICCWVMEVIVSMAIILITDNSKTDDINSIAYISKGDSNIETFEDRFLDVLTELYNLEIATNIKTGKKK